MVVSGGAGEGRQNPSLQPLCNKNAYWSKQKPNNKREPE
jgi:hypothetical protein